MLGDDLMWWGGAQVNKFDHVHVAGESPCGRGWSRGNKFEHFHVVGVPIW